MPHVSRALAEVETDPKPRSAAHNVRQRIFRKLKAMRVEVIPDGLGRRAELELAKFFSGGGSDAKMMFLF